VFAFVFAVPKTFPPSVEACYGENVTLFCHYNDLPSQAKIAWYYYNAVSRKFLSHRGKLLIGLDNEKYDVADNGTWTWISVHYVSFTDAGNYTCLNRLEDDCYSVVPFTVGERMKCLFRCKSY